MVTSMLDARNEGGPYQRVEVITGRQRRPSDGRRRRRLGLLRRALRQKRTYRMWRAAMVWLADC